MAAREAASAHADGNLERAQELEQEARKRFQSVQRRCFDDGSERTATPEG